MLENNKYFCIFGGGAIRGVAYVGVYKALKDLNIDICGYAGASAGAIAALTSALEYDDNELKEVFNKFDYSLFKDLNFSFKIELAFSKGEVFTNNIRKIIANKLNTTKPVTFKEFPKKLYILTSNISTGKTVIFSKETTPDFEVAQAVRISCCFPGLMNPEILNGECYVDGDLAKAYSFSQISPLLNPKDVRILEFRLEGNKKHTVTKNPIVFLNNAFDFMTNNATNSVINQYGNMDKYDYIVINTADILLFDLNLPQEKRDKLFLTGYNATLNYFKTKFMSKRAFLLKKYKELNAAILSSYEMFLKNDNVTAKNILLQYNFDSNNDRVYLDDDIVNSFRDIVLQLDKKNISILFLKFKTNNFGNVDKKYNILKEKLVKKIEEMKNFPICNKK